MKIRLKHRRLAEEIARSGMTQNRWAQKLGVSSGHLSMLVNGRRLYPNSRTRQRLLSRLGLEFDDLFVVEYPPSATRNAPNADAAIPLQEPNLEGRNTMSNLFNDIRYSTRLLVRRPAFSLAAVMTLGLGIGAATLIFSVVHGLLIQPLPYPDVDNVLTIWQEDRAQGVLHDDVSPANFFDLRDRQESFQMIAALEPFGFDYALEGEAREFRARRVTADFFEILGATARLGRTFLSEEFVPGQHQKVVLSDGLWRRQFGSDPDILNQTLQLDGNAYEVVGVMPPEFRYPLETEIWAPRPQFDGDQQQRRATYFWVIGRLKPEAGLPAAQAEMDALAEQLREEYPEANAGVGITLLPLKEHLIGKVRPALLMLMSAVTLLLLIACTNVGGLMLARGLEREREFGVRAALGAGSRRLLAQNLTESLAIALLGCILGLGLAHLGLKMILFVATDYLPKITDLTLSWPVILFATLVAVASTLLCGLAPAIQAGRVDLTQALHRSTLGMSLGLKQVRLRSLLVVCQLALAVMLLAGAGLLVRSLIGLLQIDPGFRAENVLAVQIFPGGSSSQRLSLYSETLQRFKSLPGVVEAGGVFTLPFSGDQHIDLDPTFQIEGRLAPRPGEEVSALLSTATENYFQVMQIPLLEGRFFEATDAPPAEIPAAIINRTMARRFWGDQSAIGARVHLAYGRGITAHVVGVVGDVKHHALEEQVRPEIYLHYPQGVNWSITFVLRTKGPPELLSESVKSELWAAGYRRPIDMLVSVQDLLGDSVGQERFQAALITGFSLLALLLAAVGLYGVVAFSVSQRHREIGIRVALAARPRDIFIMILSQGLGLTVLGIGAGAVGALVLLPYLDRFLFGIKSSDPITFVMVALLLALSSIMACFIPARKATRIDPVTALRAH